MTNTLFLSRSDVATALSLKELIDAMEDAYARQAREPGRMNNEQVTIFGSVGLAYQDTVACSLVYERGARYASRDEAAVFLSI